MLSHRQRAHDRTTRHLAPVASKVRSESCGLTSTRSDAGHSLDGSGEGTKMFSIGVMFLSFYHILFFLGLSVWISAWNIHACWYTCWTWYFDGLTQLRTTRHRLPGDGCWLREAESFWFSKSQKSLLANWGISWFMMFVVFGTCLSLAIDFYRCGDEACWPEQTIWPCFHVLLWSG